MKSPKKIISAALLMGLAAYSAHAQFTYTGGNLNSTQTYDGDGVDSGLNPHSLNAGSMYLANNADGTLHMDSGTLTINMNDFTAGRTGAFTGTLNVNGGTLNMNNNGEWGAALTNGAGTTGILNVASGATLNWSMSNSRANEGWRLQNSANSGAAATGEVNLNGGTFNLHLFDGTNQQMFHVSRDGSSGSTGTLNLNSGNFNVFDAASFSLDAASNGATGFINVDNGHLFMDTTSFNLGDGIIDFTSTGSGTISINGFTESDYLAWATAGQLQLDGVAVSDLSAFSYTLDGTQGVLAIPEPSTYAMLIGLSALTFVMGRRRKV